MEDTIIVLMNQYGYLGIFFLIMIENIFPPIPSEIILGLGGYMAKTTNLTLFGVIFISTIASCLGASILYYVGVVFNREPSIKTSIKRLIKILRINEKDVRKANQWFLQKGEKTVLFKKNRCLLLTTDPRLCIIKIVQYTRNLHSECVL